MHAVPKPRAVRAPHGARTFVVEWADGLRSELPHRVLRGFCPCAGCQGHGGGIRFIPGGDEELSGVEAVGTYALGLAWADGHASGIYTFVYLRRLAALLAEHGEAGVIALGELPKE
ncbi:MAG: DUF971 domain-containing protein [Polyangiaceae bacterium]|nr:DUF971 domain-containing protein [Polyangiaceae bacterium]